MVEPIAPRLQSYIACYCTQHEVKSSTGENDAIKRHCKRDVLGCCMSKKAYCFTASFSYK